MQRVDGIVNEMEILEEIESQIATNPIILYMKGTPYRPMCGFSARAVECLSECSQEFAYVDILSRPEIRSNLPKVSEWPTFPQLFIKGELVGGCDIIAEMSESGELRRMVAEVAGGS